MSDHPTPLGGTCSARFGPLRELFAAKLESGEDLGASLAVNIDGEMVVDLWGGWSDEPRTVPWTGIRCRCSRAIRRAMRREP
ncbi:MAG: beta-lactamase family protein [Gemmataceae bacterium]|nr:beta-lactamase family protein [Gemmataceae bacterium]